MDFTLFFSILINTAAVSGTCTSISFKLQKYFICSAWHFLSLLITSFSPPSHLLSPHPPSFPRLKKQNIVSLPAIFENFSFLSVPSILPQSLHVLSVFPLKWLDNLLVLVQFPLKSKPTCLLAMLPFYFCFPTETVALIADLLEQAVISCTCSPFSFQGLVLIQRGQILVGHRTVR